MPSILFEIETQMVVMEILISAEGYHIASIEATNISNASLIDYDFDTTVMTLNEMISYLNKIGVNIFPEPDAHLYVKDGGIQQLKHFELEQHIYKCMAHLCTTHKFLSSQWNQMSNRRGIVLKFQEINAPAVFEVGITPMQAFFIKMDEDSIVAEGMRIDLQLFLDPKEQSVSCIFLLSL